jgi:molecular chaperone GrpE
MADQSTPKIEPTLDGAPGPQDVGGGAAAPQARTAAAPPVTEAEPISPEEAEAASAANEAHLGDTMAELEQLRAKNFELTEQFLRAQADMQNTRRRAEEEMAKARRFAIESFAESLLPVADSLEAGLAIKDATPEQIREGAEATLRQLKSALERNKVVEIAPAMGTKFDPHRHQAISMVPGTGQEANTVVAVLQKGYLIAERVLRPALVTVAAPQ